MAVKRDAIAYTSPSTAENQNESEKVYESAPIADAEKTAILSPSLSSFLCLSTNFFNSKVKDQNIKRMVMDEDIADKELIQTATFSGAA